MVHAEGTSHESSSCRDVSAPGASRRVMTVKQGSCWSEESAMQMPPLVMGRGSQVALMATGELGWRRRRKNGRAGRGGELLASSDSALRTLFVVTGRHALPFFARRKGGVGGVSLWSIDEVNVAN
ncbi:hypothetical protein THAOC_35346 [Thalassiosira oceanica]|uniref:Uncharacterized protein n=1 Tax=Thalassiosira oceanica TaxID=159749 RepID=K0R123_THAOC|nr:hypothetical protein THAOC_35346 [Thalassiosira oceanica]|eukprot:EJK46013.1 hypothetical protein THAOC_35346 [Thalassiosira oceanica]